MPRVSRHDPRFPLGSIWCLPAILSFHLLLLLLLSPALLPVGSVRAEDPQEVGEVSREQVLTYLDRTLRALEDVLSFFQSQVTRVNLDGVIGVRIVQGTLKVLVRNLERRGQTSLLPEGLTEDLRALRDLAKYVADKSLPYVARHWPKYYQQVRPMVSDNTWLLDYPTRNLTAATTWTYEHREDMVEHESDDCLGEVFGTMSKTSEKCVISDKCWSRMTALGYHEYSLTHQIFYLQLTQLSGCIVEMLQKVEQSTGNHTSILQMQNTFCLNILGEAERLANLSFPQNQRDLFMEQAGLCGMYGYWEFFRYSWLEHILSWQNKEKGCYNNENWPQYLRVHKVTKRTELRLNDECLSHMSAIAAWALSQYVRYLTEVSLPQQTVGHQTASRLSWS